MILLIVLSNTICRGQGISNVAGNRLTFNATSCNGPFNDWSIGECGINIPANPFFLKPGILTFTTGSGNSARLFQIRSDTFRYYPQYFSTIIPIGIRSAAKDKWGNVYCADLNNIWKIDTAGVTSLLSNASQDSLYSVGGLATDFCIKATVLNGLALAELWRPDDRYLAVYGITDAMYAVNPAAGEAALKEMEQRGARLVTSAQLIGGEVLRVGVGV